jgi:hypothetical protein
MISRYYGRPTDDAEISQHLGAGHNSDDLAGPAGVLLLAQSADRGGSRPTFVSWAWTRSGSTCRPG